MGSRGPSQHEVVDRAIEGLDLVGDQEERPDHERRDEDRDRCARVSLEHHGAESDRDDT